MKVIKAPNTTWKKRLTCSNCTTELEADQSDLYKKFQGADSSDPRERSVWLFYVYCPTCIRAIYISESELNPAIQRVAICYGQR